MKNIFVAMTVFGMGFFGNLEGILSPLSQSAVEIKAILEDKRLSEAFGESEEIVNIRKHPMGTLSLEISIELG